MQTCSLQVSVFLHSEDLSFVAGTRGQVQSTTSQNLGLGVIRSAVAAMPRNFWWIQIPETTDRFEERRSLGGSGD